MDAADFRQIEVSITRTMQHIVSLLRRQHWAHVLYNHNPFYVVSAALVFWGLRSAFDTRQSLFNAWPLTLCLAAFTVLLVTTAVLIIRWGKVWEDARSILLLVVLMFLGISVTFDSVLANDPAHAKWYYLGGLLFAVTTSECALRFIPLRLPALYRAPFYLIVALFYLYPLSMTDRLNRPSDAVLQWQLFGFSSVAAIIFLLLIPAVRRRPAYANDNLSPWRWPLFPWVLFGMLWFCVCLRAYYLCISLHFVGYSSTIFGWYFLTPMLLAAAFLFIEAGKVTNTIGPTRLGMALPLIGVVISGFDHSRDQVYGDFLRLYTQTLHVTPLFAALLIAIGFYAIAWVRQVQSATAMFVTAVALIAFVGPRSLSLHDVQIERAWPFAIAGAFQCLIGLRRWVSPHVAIGVCLVLIGAIVQWQNTWFTSHQAALPLHLLLLIFLVVGLVFDDEMAHRLRRWSALLITAFGLGAIVGAKELSSLPFALVVLYPLGLVIVAMIVGRRLRMPPFYFSAALIGGVWVATYGTQTYVGARDRVVGFDQLTLGMLFFGCAMLISLGKAGALQRAWERVRKRLDGNGAASVE
jgi:hypothetical protein